MYIPKYNSFFIHVTKCGGTSVELFFLNDAGLNYSYNDMTNGGTRSRLQEYFIAKKLKPQLGYETQHITALDAKNRGIRQFLNADYTFALVRNPWNRFVSETMWMQQKRNIQEFTFDEALASYEYEYKLEGKFNPHCAPMWKYLYDKDMNLLVDDVFKLEELDKAEKALSKRFGIPVKFGKHNTTERTEELTEDVKEKLYPLIKKDLELFNYE